MKSIIGKTKNNMQQMLLKARSGFSKNKDDVFELFALAEDFERKNMYKKALKTYEKALARCGGKNKQENLHRAVILNKAAAICTRLGDDAKAIEYSEASLSIMRKRFGYNSPASAEAYNNIAAVRMKNGDFENALLYYNTSLLINEQFLGFEHVSTADSYQNIALLYQKQGKYKKSVDFFTKALSIYENAYGRFDPRTAAIYNNIAVICDAYKKWDLALYCSLVAAKAYLGGNDPETLSTIMDNLRSTFVRSGIKGTFEDWFSESISNL